MAGDFRLGAGPSEGDPQLRPRSGEVHGLRLRLGPRAADDAALWHRRPAAVLRRRSAISGTIFMLVPESWLRTFCNPSISGKELAERLTMAGLEVESYAPAGAQFSGVVVGEIVSVEKHPNADKLTVCVVDAGASKVRVVCGAPNVRAGMKAPLAVIGAELPGLQIKETSLRGVQSQGMLCSARELGLSSDHSGLFELPSSARTGA